MRYGGAERVLKTFLEIYPDADIYSLFGKEDVEKAIGIKSVNYSWLQNIPILRSIYRYTYFLWPIAIESLDLREYDLVISNSFSVSKGAITTEKSTHIAYVNSPMRYAWSMKDIYFSKEYFGPVRGLIISILIHYLRIWDVTSSRRPDIVIANSSLVKERWEKYYGGRVNKIITPPVETPNMKWNGGEYLLAIAPFEPNKMPKLLLDVCKKNNLKLLILGEGGSFKQLRREYESSKIQFLGWVSEERKFEVMREAKALVIPGIEDYGITAAEGVMVGLPVVAYRKSGATDIIDQNTGIFFEQLTEDSLLEGIKKLEGFKVSKRKKVINSKESFKREFLSVL
jgi:glycosyltransferase involved in cell wall biosynthesis